MPVDPAPLFAKFRELKSRFDDVHTRFDILLDSVTVSKKKCPLLAEMSQEMDSLTQEMQAVHNRLHAIIKGPSLYVVH